MTSNEGKEMSIKDIEKRIKKMTRTIREDERMAVAAREYAEALKTSSLDKIIKVTSSFKDAARMLDMYSGRDWGNLTADKKNLLNVFMDSAQKAEKFRMDQTNWSKKAQQLNDECIKKHMREGLGLLPFDNILFQTKLASKFDKTIFFHLFEYKDKNLDLNLVNYDYRLLRVVNNNFTFEADHLKKINLSIPLDFSRYVSQLEKMKVKQKHFFPSYKGYIKFAWQTFLQLNSHTDKNTNIGIHDIKSKEDSGIGSLRIKDNNSDNKDFIPVWKSKTVYVRPEEYKQERDTVYTKDITDDDNALEKRYIPYHSVRGHIRRLQKGDITNVRSHFRGKKEYGAIHKNYVLGEPRILRKGVKI